MGLSYSYHRVYNEKQILASPPKLFGSVRILVLIFAFSATFLYYFNMYNYSMALVCMTGTHTGNGTTTVIIKAEFDWDKMITSNLLSAFFYGYVCSQVFGGVLSDIFGERIVLVPSSLLLGISTALLPPAARFDWRCMMAVRVLQGFLSGLGLPSLYNLIRTWSPSEELGLFVGITFAGCPFAIMVNYPISSLLCFTGVDGGWPMIFYLPAGGILLWTVLFIFFTYKTPSEHPKISAAELKYIEKDEKTQTTKRSPPWISIFTSPPFYASCVVNIGCSWAYTLFALNLPFFISETFDVDIVMNGVLCAMTYIGCVMMTPTGILYDKIKAKNIMSPTNLNKVCNTIAFSFPVVSLCTVTFLPESLQIVSFSIALAFIQLSWTSGYMLCYPEYAGPYAGVVYGIACTVGQLGGIVNPIIVAKLASNGTPEEWANVFYIAAVITAFSGLVYALFGSLKRQKWAM